MKTEKSQEVKKETPKSQKHIATVQFYGSEKSKTGSQQIKTAVVIVNGLEDEIKDKVIAELIKKEGEVVIQSFYSMPEID
jgi:hypothetical protein